jgi:AraC family transcriptional regulator
VHNRIERAVALLEQDGEADPLSLEVLAARVGMSPFHFARMFTIALGIPPMAYRRRHLLERAARVLAAEPERPIIEIAFEAGFDSQQTFTRAFRRMFGRTPGQQRTTKMVNITTHPERFDIGSPIKVQRQPEPVAGDAMRLAGAIVSIDGKNGKCPRDAWKALENAIPCVGRSFGICWSRKNAEAYDYMAAVELPEGRPPSGLSTRTLAAQQYLVFHQHFEVADFAGQLKRGLEEIWAVQLPASGFKPSGGPDLEVYSDELIAGVTAGILSYWIPVL